VREIKCSVQLRKFIRLKMSMHLKICARQRRIPIVEFHSCESEFSYFIRTIFCIKYAAAIQNLSAHKNGELFLKL
jgi:hypothetical protein